MVSSLILLSACTYQFINTLILSIFRYVTSADLNFNGIYGCNGRAKITTSDGITFDFKESKKSTWGFGGVSCGILDEIFYIKQ